MDFGVVLQTNPPAWRTVGLAKQAEEHGFDYVWTFDSHLLWQEPYVIYSQILAETRRVIVGPMVTNPATRDWTVTASVFATLNEMYGNRTVCGIGRGDSAVRVLNGRPTTLKEVREATHVIRELAQLPAGGAQRLDPAVPVGAHVGARGVDRRLRPAGAQDRRRGRATASSSSSPTSTSRSWMIERVRDGRRGRRPRPRRPHVLRRRAGLRRPDDPSHWPHARASAAGSAAWSATTSPTSSASTATGDGGATSRRCSSTTSRAAPATTTTPTARPTTTTSTSCPTRSSTGSACSAPPSSTSPSSRSCEAIGVDQFAVYLQHDNKEETMRVYGESVMPHLRDHVTAKA